MVGVPGHAVGAERDDRVRSDVVDDPRQPGDRVLRRDVGAATVRVVEPRVLAHPDGGEAGRHLATPDAGEPGGGPPADRGCRVPRRGGDDDDALSGARREPSGRRRGTPRRRDAPRSRGWCRAVRTWTATYGWPPAPSSGGFPNGRDRVISRCPGCDVLRSIGAPGPTGAADREEPTVYNPITHYVHMTEGRLPAVGSSLDIPRAVRPTLVPPPPALAPTMTATVSTAAVVRVADGGDVAAAAAGTASLSCCRSSSGTRRSPSHRRRRGGARRPGRRLGRGLARLRRHRPPGDVADPRHLRRVVAILTGSLVNTRLLIYSASLVRWSNQPLWFRLVAAAGDRPDLGRH